MQTQLKDYLYKDYYHKKKEIYEIFCSYAIINPGTVVANVIKRKLSL
jgi:hypothetical protein